MKLSMLPTIKQRILQKRQWYLRNITITEKVIQQLSRWANCILITGYMNNFLQLAMTFQQLTLAELCIRGGGLWVKNL